MSATLIRRIVDLFIAIFVIAGLLGVFQALTSTADGGFGTISWPVQAASVSDQLQLNGNAVIDFDDGQLVASGQPIAHALDLAVELGTLVIFIAALLALRSVLVRFAEGAFLAEENIAALRKIGRLLMIICGISIVHVLVMQPLILSAIEMPSDMVLHPSVSWDVDGVKNIWLHYSPPIFTFMLGGLALLFSKALMVGSAYQEDSEKVV